VALMALIVNLQVLARYAFDKPFIWPEEVSRMVLIWMTFLGAAALIRRGGDIAVDTFIDMLPPHWRRAIPCGSPPGRRGNANSWPTLRRIDLFEPLTKSERRRFLLPIWSTRFEERTPTGRGDLAAR